MEEGARPRKGQNTCLQKSNRGSYFSLARACQVATCKGSWNKRGVAGDLCHIPKIELLFLWREAKHGFWVVSKDYVIIKQTNTLNQIILFEPQMNFKSKTWIKAMQGEKKEREREKKGKNRAVQCRHAELTNLKNHWSGISENNDLE